MFHFSSNLEDVKLQICVNRVYEEGNGITGAWISSITGFVCVWLFVVINRRSHSGFNTNHINPHPQQLNTASCCRERNKERNKEPHVPSGSSSVM